MRFQTRGWPSSRLEPDVVPAEPRNRALIHPLDGQERLASLGRHAIHDVAPSKAFDDLVRLAAHVCGVPVALVSLVDATRRWFEARFGLETAETPIDASFCAHAMRGQGLFVVPDAKADPRFAGHPFVEGGPGIRFYAGSPLIDPQGYPLGTLCVIDYIPRILTPIQATMLTSLGRHAVALLELRWALVRARQAEARAAQARATAVLKSTRDAIETVDSRGPLQAFNEVPERSFGDPRECVIGRPLVDLLSSPDGEGIVPFRDVSGLRRNEDAQRLLAAIVESSDDAIVTKDLDGIVTSWNGGAERIFGYSSEEAIGRHISFLLPPDRADELAKVLGRVRAGERVEHYETKRVTKDGRILDISLSVSPVCDVAGRIVGASKVARDITERKQSEEALRRSEAEARRLALVASRTDNVVIITDAAGRIEWVNEGFARITGYALEEVVGRRPGSFLQGVGTDPETVRRIRARLAAGEGFTGEILNYSKSGREYWLAMDIQPIRDEAGALTNFIAIESDITDRKRAEAELRQAHVELTRARDQLEERVRVRTSELAAQSETLRRAEEDYRGIFENAVEGIYQSTAGGRYVRANPALARMLGYAGPDELIAEMGDIGRQLYTDPGRREEFCRLVDERGSVSGFESRVRRKDGRVIWISENARAARSGDDGVVRYEGIVADITERRRAETEIRALNTELASAYDATIEGWAKALDLRDKETEGHTRRVTEMSLRLGRALGLGDEDLVHIRRGALLHDIGKLGVPDAILLKQGPLTDEEWVVMRRHPSNARDWLHTIPVLRPALEIPYSHHERWDGTGYPQGLAGEAIPLAARLFAAVDVWDALRSDRPYRAAWPEDRVRDHLKSLAGTHLDPLVVATLLRMLDEPSPVRDGGETTAPLGHTVNPAPDSSRRGRGDGLPRPSAGSRRRREGRLTRLRELERDNARLAELATTDDLTGLWNRRHFRQALQTAFDDAKRERQPLTLVLLDLDHFKAYNDEYGHPAGDEVLRELASLLRSEMRVHDVVARHGGEEFAALLPATDAAGSRAWSERLRATMADHRWPRSPVTASFGLSTLTRRTVAPADMIEQADRAMYRAKRLGRDRVAHYDEPTAPVLADGSPSS